MILDKLRLVEAPFIYEPFYLVILRSNKFSVRPFQSVKKKNYDYNYKYMTDSVFFKCPRERLLNDVRQP